MVRKPCKPIRDYRVRNNLTQKALAGALGVTDVTVSRWETGTRKIDDAKVHDVARKLEIPARELRPDLAKVFEEVAQ